MKILKQQNTGKSFPGKYIFRNVFESTDEGNQFEIEKEQMKQEVLAELNKLKDEFKDQIDLKEVEKDFKEKNGQKEKIVKRRGERVKILRREGGEVIKIKGGKVKIKDSWVKSPSLKVKNGQIKKIDDRYKTKKQDAEFKKEKQTGTTRDGQQNNALLNNITEQQSAVVPKKIEEAQKGPSGMEELKSKIDELKSGYTQGAENIDEYIQKIKEYRSQLTARPGSEDEKAPLFKKLDELKQSFENEKKILEERKQTELIQNVDKIAQDKNQGIERQQTENLENFETELAVHTEKVEARQRELERKSEMSIEEAEARYKEAFKSIESGNFQIEKETGFNAENLKTVGGAKFELQKHFQAAETFGIETEVLNGSAEEMGNIYQEFQNKKDSPKNTILGVVALVAAPFEGGRNMTIAACKRLGGWLGWGKLEKWAGRAEHTSVLGVLTGENEKAKKLTAQKEKFEQKYKEQSQNLGAKADRIAVEGKQIKDAIVTNLPDSQEIEKKDALDELEQSIAKEEKLMGVKMSKDKKQEYLNSFSAKFGKNELVVLKTLKSAVGNLESLHQNLKANHMITEEWGVSIGKMEFKAADVWDATLGTLGRGLQKLGESKVLRFVGLGGVAKSIGKFSEGIGSIASRPDRFVNALAGAIGFDFSKDRKSKYVWGGGNLRRFYWDGLIKGTIAAESWKEAKSFTDYVNALTESATNVAVIFFTGGAGGATAGGVRAAGIIGRASAKTALKTAGRTGMRVNMARGGIFAKEVAKNVVSKGAWKESITHVAGGWKNIGKGIGRGLKKVPGKLKKAPSAIKKAPGKIWEKVKAGFKKIKNIKNSKKLARGKDVVKTGSNKAKIAGGKVTYGFGWFSKTSVGKKFAYLGKPLVKATGKTVSWTVDAMAWPFRKVARNISRKSRTEFKISKTRTRMRPSQWFKKKTWGKVKVSPKIKGFTRRERWSHSRVSKLDRSIAAKEVEVASVEAKMGVKSTKFLEGQKVVLDKQLTKARNKRTKLLENPRRKAAYDKINASKGLANSSEWTVMVDEVLKDVGSTRSLTKSHLRIGKFDKGLGKRLEVRANKAEKAFKSPEKELGVLQKTKASAEKIKQTKAKISLETEKYYAFKKLSTKVEGLSLWETTAPVTKKVPVKKTITKKAPVKTKSSEKIVNTTDDAYLVRDPKVKKDPNFAKYKESYMKAESYFENVIKNKKSFSVKEFEKMCNEMHIKASKNYVGKGEISVESGIIRNGENVMSSGRTYMNEYVQQLGFSVDEVLKINGVSESGIANSVGRHFYPSGMKMPQYFKAGSEHLNKFLKTKDINALSDYYHTMINARPYGQVNQSLFMNQVNFLLNKTGKNPVSHGSIDHIAQRVSFKQFRSVFKKHLDGSLKNPIIENHNFIGLAP